MKNKNVPKVSDFEASQARNVNVPDFEAPMAMTVSGPKMSDSKAHSTDKKPAPKVSDASLDYPVALPKQQVKVVLLHSPKMH